MFDIYILPAIIANLRRHAQRPHLPHPRALHRTPGGHKNKNKDKDEDATGPMAGPNSSQSGPPEPRREPERRDHAHAFRPAIAASEGHILFATTNHLERLDPALSHPGHMDVRVEFRNAGKWQAEALFCNFFPSTEESATKNAEMEKELRGIDLRTMPAPLAFAPSLSTLSRTTSM
ncbi:hypothetical protein FIBSPDRAFT_963327 [Athelia psychrophila]|uniref:ATPase AAA-type core domain-containing protein n=1 Tax=Athelia psychrophila TaxID=1759441 RepID=A0A165Z1T5_9AGAM|nr:hypothetical protein FIBSPDRAFT_963327 [Fibularhizoctonia sp. CBS 109695]